MLVSIINWKALTSGKAVCIDIQDTVLDSGSVAAGIHPLSSALTFHDHTAELLICPPLNHAQQLFSELHSGGKGSMCARLGVCRKLPDRLHTGNCVVQLVHDHEQVWHRSADLVLHGERNMDVPCRSQSQPLLSGVFRSTEGSHACFSSSGG